MNILFMCKRTSNKEKAIRIINYNNNKIISLKIDEKSLNNKLDRYITKMLLKWHFRTDKTYVVMCDEFESNIKVINYIKSILENIIIVTDQNNLLKNDYIYINEYINEKELKRRDIKVLVIIDKISNIEKQKIKELIEKYKVVDIYSTRQNENLDRFVDELNNNLGTTIQILDKIELKYYNILLVFSQEYINIKHNSSFVLDYNNSNLDVKSNTYLVYINNKEKIEMLLRKLDINSQNFKCTKLGKLCIHLKWNNA